MDISQYKSFYKKSPKARYLKFRSDKDFLSKHLDFTQQDQVSVCEKRCYCLNDSNNVKQYLLESERDVIYVSEGLIKTYPTSKFVQFVEDYISKHTSKALQQLRFCDISSGDQSTQCVSQYVSKEAEVDGISPALSFTVAFNRDDDIQEFMSKLVDQAYIYGYSFTATDTYDHDLMPEIVVKIVQFEAKYNANLFEFADTLVHVAPLKYLPKILRNGLVPYSKSVEYKYNDRVYLFNKCSEELTLQYGNYKMNACNDNGFCIFKIDSKELQNDHSFKSGKLRFYVDSSFDFDSSASVPAIFTYGNIKKELLGNGFLKYEMVNGSLQMTVERIS